MLPSAWGAASKRALDGLPSSRYPDGSYPNFQIMSSER
jgi:hypothetical protein